MSWTQGNASLLRNLINTTDFVKELGVVKPKLGGTNDADRLDKASKRELWDEIIEKLDTMSQIQEVENDQESANINIDFFNVN